MPVFDGQAVDAAVTNPAFIDRQQADSAFGIYTLANTAPASGPTIVNIQGLMNHLITTTGATPTSDGTTYTSHQRITDGDSHPLAISELDTAFHGTTGHKHTGATGDGPPIAGSSITGNPLRGTFLQGVDMIGVTGGSVDVSSQFSSAVPSTSSSVEGVVANTPYNRTVIRQASGASEDDSYTDGSGHLVYGRLTNSGGVGGTWTLTFYVLIAGVETAFIFGSASDVRFYYQKLFNPLTDAPVYSELAFIPSDNVTADVVTASTTVQGKVQLATATPADVGSSGSAGTANATVANANHVHKGVHSLDSFFGDVTIAGAGGTTVSDATNTVTITSPSFGTTAASVGSANAGGSASTMSKSDHVHQGVHSLDSFFGDVTIAGAGGTTVSDATNTVTITSPSFGSAPPGIASAGAAGSAATMSRSDHTHQGVGSFAKTSGTLRYGAISLTPGTNVTITDNADGTFTIASSAGIVIVPVNAQSADYTLTTSDQVVSFTGTHNATLPTAVGNSGLTLTVVNVGTSTTTVLTTSSQTYGGRASGDMVLQPRDFATFVSDGANWIILATNETNVLSSVSSSLTFATIGASGRYGAGSGNSVTLGIGKWRVYGYFILYTGTGANNFLDAGSGFYAANGSNSSSVPTALTGTYGQTSWPIEANTGAGLGSGPGAPESIFHSSTQSFTIICSSSTTVYLVPQVNVGSGANQAITMVIWAERA